MSEYEDYKDRATKRAKERSSGKSFKLEQGDNTFRVLMTPKGRRSPSAFFEFAVHENVGSEKAYLRCGIDPTTGKGSCLCCQKEIPRLRKRGKDSRAAELEPKNKLVVQVAKVVDDKITGKPQLWYPSKKTGDTLVSQIIGSKKRDYLSHKKGYNLSLSRTGTGMQDTRYGPIEADQEPSKVPASIVENLKPFDELTEIPKYDEKKMKLALGYTGRDDEEDLEDEDEPKSKKRNRDDDDEDEDEDDDEPKSKKSKSKKKSKDEDDDEDEDSDDDDEDDSDDDEDEDEDNDSDGDEDDEDDDDSDDDEDDDEDEPKSKRKSSKSKSVKKKRK